MECLKVCHDIKNTTIMELSPIENIAKLLDFNYPYFFVMLLDIIEDKGIEGMKAEFEVANESINDKNYHMHLAELFWAVYTKLYSHIEDILFLNDYYLYLNFFLQYPILTGKDAYPGMTFESILNEYRKTNIKGSVYRFIKDVEYVLVVGKNRGADDEDDMLEEISEIEKNIKNYQSNNLLYQAQEISDKKGEVSLLLKDGNVVTGKVDRIGGIYAEEGYTIRTALTFELDECEYVFIEEEQIEKILS